MERVVLLWDVVERVHFVQMKIFKVADFDSKEYLEICRKSVEFSQSVKSGNPVYREKNLHILNMTVPLHIYEILQTDDTM